MPAMFEEGSQKQGLVQTFSLKSEQTEKIREYIQQYGKKCIAKTKKMKYNKWRRKKLPMDGQPGI